MNRHFPLTTCSGNLTIIINLYVYIFVCPVTTPRLLGLRGSDFWGLMEITLGTLLQSLIKIGLFTNSSQTFGSKGFKYTGFNEGHPEVVISKFGQDQSKFLPVGLFQPENVLVVIITVYLSKPFHLLQLCNYIRQQNCAQTTSSSFSLLLF